MVNWAEIVTTWRRKRLSLAISLDHSDQAYCLGLRRLLKAIISYVFLCIHYAERQTINFYHILITVSVFSSRRQSESGKYTKDRSAGVAWKMVATYSVYTIVVIVPPEERRRAYGIISQYTQHSFLFICSPKMSIQRDFLPLSLFVLNQVFCFLRRQDYLAWRPISNAQEFKFSACFTTNALLLV